MSPKHLFILIATLILFGPASALSQQEHLIVRPYLIAQSSKESPLSHVISLDANVGKNGVARVYLAGVFMNSVVIMQKEGEKLKIIKRIGQRGKGPGDFLTVTNLQVLNDKNLIIFDKKLGRVTNYNLKSDQVDHIFNLTVVGKKGYYPMKLYVTNNSKLQYFVGAEHFFRASDAFKKQRNVLLQQYNSKGALWKDSLLIKPDDEALVVRKGGSMAVNPHAVLGKKSIFRFKNDKIYYGWSGDDKIEIYSEDGIHVKSLKLDLPHLVVTKNDVKLALNLESLMLQEKKHFIQASFQEMIPDYWPYFHNFLLDGRGRIWVGGGTHLSSDNRIWYIFSSEGKLLKKAILPSKFTVFKVKENYIFGELLDKNFRSFVQIYHLK